MPESAAYRLSSDATTHHSQNVISFHNRRKLPVHRLPFFGKNQDEDTYSFWHIPKSGGYAGGCETGSALAVIYLKYLRAHGAVAGGSLQHIVLDMFDGVPGDDEEISSLRGQVVGFFSVLDKWLAGSARVLGGRLDSDENADLLKQANDGLNYDCVG